MWDYLMMVAVIWFYKINWSVLHKVSAHLKQVTPQPGRGNSCAAGLRPNSLSGDFQRQLHHNAQAFILN